MNKIRSLLSQGKHDEMEDQRVSYFINVIMKVTIVLLFLLGISKILLPPFRNEVACILWISAALILINYLIFRKRRSRFAGLIIIGIVWIAASVLAWTNEGVKDIAIFSYIICIILAICLSRYWLAVIITALSLLSVWGLVYAEQKHILIPTPDTQENYALDFTALVIIIITLLFLYRNSYVLLFSRIKTEFNDKLNTEKSLRENKSLIESISNNLTSGLIYQLVWKPDGSIRFTYLSKSVKQLYGVTPEEGMADASLIYRRVHKDDIELLKKAGSEALELFKIFRVEVRVLDPSGTVRWSSLVSTPKQNEDGSISWDGIELDITDRMKTLEELENSRRKERAIMDLSFGFMGLLDPEGTVLDINRTALEFAGVQLSEIKGKPFCETPWWSHTDETKNQIREAVKKASMGELVKVETMHTDKDGGLHIIEFTLKPVFDEKGNVSFLIPEGHDITESRKINDILNENKERFRTLSLITTEGIMIHKDRIIIEANQSFAKILGYSSPEELIGKDAIDFTPFTPESRKIVLDNLLNNSDKTFDVELVNLKGTIVPIETRGKEINYLGSKARLVYIRDITDRKKAEEKLRASEERYRKAQEIGHVGSWEFDIKTNSFSGGSVEGIRIFGLDPENEISTLDEITECIIDKEFYTKTFFDNIENKNYFSFVFEIIPQNSTEKRIVNLIGEVTRDKNGNPVKVTGVVHDVTEQKESEKELQYQSRLQKLLLNMATIFINLPVEEVNSVMNISLGELAGVIEADRIMILHYNFQESVAHAMNEWTSEGIEPAIDFYTSLPLNVIPANELEKHLRGEPTYISDTQFVNDSGLQTIFMRGGAKSFLAVPMIGHGECYGFVAISWIRSYHSFKEDELRTLKVFALMLVNLQIRKKMDVSLMKSEEKFRELVENINDVLFTLNSDGILTYISPQVCYLHNYQPEELIGHPMSEIVHPDDFEDLRKRFYSKVESDRSPLEFRFINHDGLTSWAQASIHPIIENGRMTGIYGLFSDITKRKEDEEALRKLSLAVEQSPASIVITNLAGEIEYINPRFTQVSGYLPEEVIGRNPNILKSGHTPREVYQELWSQISAGKEWKGEFYNRKKNGELFWEAVTVSPIINDKREITHYLGVKEDITEKKEATRRIFDVIIETEERERLRYSHELHDGLGPILSTINLYFQMLAEKVDEDQKNAIIKRASSCINEAIQTIKDISYNLSPNVLSKFGIVSGINNFINRLNETEKSYFDFYSNVEEQRFEKNIEITIYRIVTELLNNTIKYSGASQTEVKLNYSEKESFLILDYIDNGCGFDLNEVMSTRKGLGISNIFQRVSTLNGKINIETETGKGVKVHIELPVTR